MTVTIYALSDPLYPTVIRYIGKTKYPLRVRISNHVNCVNRHRCHKSTWIKSLLKQGRYPIIWPLEFCTVENWEERERYWIAFFKPTGWLTNHKDGGGVHEQPPVKESTRLKLRLGRIGKTLTPQQRQRVIVLRSKCPRTERQKEQFLTMLKTRKRRVLTPEGKAKLSAARKGKPITPNHLKQILNCSKIRKRPVVCLTTGQCFESETAACDFIGVNRSKILRAIKRNGTCRNMKWAYANKL